MPPTIALSGISLVTTAFAPTSTLFPMHTFPIILAPQHTTTLFPNIGYPWRLPPLEEPIVTCCITTQFSPIEHLEIIIEKQCPKENPFPISASSEI